jgi:predicted aspartyl protease
VIDGDPEKLVLDTGATHNILGQVYVERRGMQIIETPRLGYGLTGKELDQITRVSQLTLGNMIARDPSFVIGIFGGDGSKGGSVGLFGSEYLANFDVEIDPMAGRINLFSPRHCPGAGVYWAPEFFQVPVYLTQTNRIEVQIEVDGKTLKGLIDTGAPETTMRLATAEAVFDIVPDGTNGPAHRKFSGVDGVKIDAFSHTFKSLTFGGITLRDTKMTIADIDQGKGAAHKGSRIVGNHAQPDVLIGMSLLRKLHLFIAYSESSVYFTLAETKTTAAPKADGSPG